MKIILLLTAAAKVSALAVGLVIAIWASYNASLVPVAICDPSGNIT
jgi:hypothetical protein